MPRHLSTFSSFAERYSNAFTEPGLRWTRFNCERNGFAGAFVKVGRRVLIDEDRFFECIDRQNPAPEAD